MTSRVTLSQVAARAGVSQAAASKVFNERDDVSEETVRKVRQVAAELGYRAPVRKTNGQIPIWITVGVLRNYYAPEVLSGVLNEASRSGALAIISEDPGDNDSPPGSKKWLTSAHRSGARAFIFITSSVNEQALTTTTQLGTPLVVVDPVTRPPKGVATVGATNFRGGKDATAHLIGLGHRRIAFVGANLDSTPGSERLAGYLDALREAGLGADPELIIPGRFHSDDGHAAAALLQRTDPPTAIFAAADAVAFGLYDACHELGIRIPDDVSVIGFDDGLGGELVWPHLTTVRQPLYEMGQHAIRTCVTAITSGQQPNLPIELATTLVVRDSTASPQGVGRP